MKPVVTLSLVALVCVALIWHFGGSPEQPVTHPPATAAVPSAKSAVPAARDSAPKAGASTKPAAPLATTPSPAAVSAECESILRLDSPAQRQLAFSRLLEKTRDEAGIKAILATFAKLYDQGIRSGAEWTLFWSEMVVRDPRAAADLVASYKDRPKWQKGGVAQVVYEWSRSNPQATAAWLAAQTGLADDAMDLATVNLIGGYADKDLAAATAYALKMLPEGDSAWGDTSWVLTSTAMDRGGEPFLTKWFDDLPPAAKERLFAATNKMLGRKNQEAQVKWLSAQAASPWRDDKTYREMAASWAKTDPAAALDWVFALPPSPKEGGIVGAGYAAFPWMIQDLAGFTNYYHQQSPERQRILRDVIKLVTNDPKVITVKRDAGTAFLKSLGQ